MKSNVEGFLGKGAKFRSKEQRLGLRAVLDGESPLEVILLTGRGKSLLLMLPAWLETWSYFVTPACIQAQAVYISNFCPLAESPRWHM
jgi:hypothetical protein